jgi:hypothetical protein
VQTEPDDEQDGEIHRTARGRLADRQSFGEVVQADADRDEQRGAFGLAERVDAPAKVLERDAGPTEVSER